MAFSKCAIMRLSLLLLHGSLIWWFLLCLVHNTHGVRVRRSAFHFEDAAIHSELVDKNNATIWAMFNVSEDQMKSILESNEKNKNSSAQPRDSQYFNNVKEYRINDILNRIESALQASNSEESQEHPLHEMAAYPICNSESNESSWLHDNNVTIRFSDTLFRSETKRESLNLDSAILRLYKVNPNSKESPAESDEEVDDNHKPKRCADQFLDTQIRVTVSIVHQLRRNKQRKKRICNTMMMNVSKTGWVEIDIKRAIYIWENVERQQHQHQHQQQQQQQQQHQQQQAQSQVQQSRQPVMVGWLMIEVHDEEERPLKPGLYFKPPKCDQADFAIPWNYYGPQASMSPFTAVEVPRYPRLDVKLIGYASFVPKNYNKQIHLKLRDNLRRQLNNLSKNSAELDIESTTPIAPTADNLLESSASTEFEQHNHRKRHSHHYNIHHTLQQQQQQQDLSTNLNLNSAENEHAHTHRRRRRQHNIHHTVNQQSAEQPSKDC